MSRWLLIPIILMLAGCATTPPITTEMSEQMRRMAELRDTCTQYAAWAARDLKADTPELKRVQGAYIEASAAANSYIEALQFDVAVGTVGAPEKYAVIAQRVHDTSADYITAVRNALGLDAAQTRGLPLLIIPMVEGLVSLSQKLNESVNARAKQDRELIVRALGEKKWKAFQELPRQ
jgi:uncharacterized lipoprotein YmbA